MAMVAVMVRTESRKPLGMVETFPVAIRTVMVSPKALPRPSITAAISPGEAAGKVTLNRVCHLLAPSANEASLKL